MPEENPQVPYQEESVTEGQNAAPNATPEPSSAPKQDTPKENIQPTEVAPTTQQAESKDVSSPPQPTPLEPWGTQPEKAGEGAPVQEEITDTRGKIQGVFGKLWSGIKSFWNTMLGKEK